MPVTMKEIAAEAGVSQQAVSQALNQTGRLREETRQRVLHVAGQLGYRVNSSAKAMRSGRFGAFALLQSVHAHASSLPRDALNGIHEAVDRLDFRLTMGRLPDQKLTNAGYIPKILRELSADGLLINYTDHIPARLRQLILQFGVPSVWMNCRLESDCVHHDDELAGRLATQHLLELGHRKIAYVDFHHSSTEVSESHHSAYDRQTGYRSSMQLAGFEPTVFWADADMFQGADPNQGIAEWLRSDGAPTAVVAYSNQQGQIIAYGSAVAGRLVGRDMSIVAISTKEPDEHFDTVDAHVLLDQPRLGSEAVKMLERKARQAQTQLDPCPIRPELRPGRSAAAHNP